VVSREIGAEDEQANRRERPRRRELPVVAVPLSVPWRVHSTSVGSRSAAVKHRNAAFPIDDRRAGQVTRAVAGVAPRK
jgi:hypothetical protein